MQTKTFPLAKDLFWIGVNDYDLRIFDITMKTEYGTSYNAYLVKGSEKTALIDTAKVNFQEDYIAKINSLCELTKIDYLIMNHAEPDHSGTIEKLVTLHPELIVIATGPGLVNIREIVNRPFHSIQAKEDMTISLGNRTLRFFMLPNLHWPDTMFTYLEEEATLFPCDFFGAHYAFEGVLAQNVQNKKEYDASLKYYFDCIMSPFKKFVIKALDRIRDLKIRYVATGHGPIVDSSNYEEVTAWYREWSKPKLPNPQPLVILPIASVYGYSKKMALAVKDGIQNAFNGQVTIELIDLVETPVHEVVARIDQADAFAIASTTILADSVPPVWHLLAELNPQIHGGKFATVFGSYGWSGEAVANVGVRLKQLKMKTIDGIRIRFNPSEEQLKEAVAFGEKFGFFMQGINTD